MNSYFELTDFDRKFYADKIAPHLPEMIFDVHVHLNLEEHTREIPEERFLSDWALQCGHLLPVEDAYACAQELFPDAEHFIAGFPWPIKEADIHGNNEYLADMHKRGKLWPFMAVRPEWDIEHIEETLVGNDFVGFKPYPDMVSGVKGADISIFDFFPHRQWEILDRYSKAVMLHLPRAERLADADNIGELLDARQKYPDVTIIIAHFGRSFCPYYLDKGLEQLGDPGGFYFDTSAVLNPEVYDLAFSKIPVKNILYGSDMPITLWHGMREWTEKTYINLTRENYLWNKNRRSPEEEAAYTIFLYEEVVSILEAARRNSLESDHLRDIFYRNSIRALNIETNMKTEVNK